MFALDVKEGDASPAPLRLLHKLEIVSVLTPQNNLSFLLLREHLLSFTQCLNNSTQCC